MMVKLWKKVNTFSSYYCKYNWMFLILLISKLFDNVYRSTKRNKARLDKLSTILNAKNQRKYRRYWGPSKGLFICVCSRLSQILSCGSQSRSWSTTCCSSAREHMSMRCPRHVSSMNSHERIALLHKARELWISEWWLSNFLWTCLRTVYGQFRRSSLYVN